MATNTARDGQIKHMEGQSKEDFGEMLSQKGKARNGKRHLDSSEDRKKRRRKELFVV